MSDKLKVTFNSLTFYILKRKLAYYYNCNTFQHGSGCKSTQDMHVFVL